MSHRPMGRVLALLALVATATVLSVGEAAAHAAERGYVMLLPTGYYMVGGAMAVAFSFAVLLLVPPGGLDRLFRLSLPLWSAGDGVRIVTSLVSFLVLAGLIVAGFDGAHDPLSNPLPLVIWTVWWVALTLVQGLIGDLWRLLDPWYGPWRLVLRLTGGNPDKPPFRLPARLGRVPAIVLFLGFSWFELVYIAPEDPDRLAVAVTGYWVFNFIGILLFGHRDWTRQVECFTPFFGFIAKLAILQREDTGEKRARIALRVPGAGAVDAHKLEISGVLLLLLALASVSFDGMTHTFIWVAALGFNPLEYPGRSAFETGNTLGLLGTFVILSGVFFIAVALGERLAASNVPFRTAVGRLVWSVVPISIAYHVAHYIIDLLVNGQYALAAISDPFSNGWNLFGTAGYHVQAGVVLGADAAWVIWNLQSGAIIVGHVLAVVIAHAIAYRLHGSHMRAVVSQLPLALLMIGYTVFGLWLLSTPTVS